MKANRRLKLGDLFFTASSLAMASSAPAGPAISTLITFEGPNGSMPQCGLNADSAGNLYGTTQTGGLQSDGTVFELSGPTHQTLTNLAIFNSSTGVNPGTQVIFDAAGNLYGTTGYTGASGVKGGTVFELSGPSYQTFTPLANFSGSNGSLPGDLMFGADGNLYGMTQQGGVNNLGTIFELSGATHQSLNTLVTFNSSSGSYPGGPLTEDASGNLYGTTYQGGTGKYGTVFKLSGTAHQTLTTLVNFNGFNGAYPNAGLHIDGAGNIVGTTLYGGATFDGSPSDLLYGTAFMLSGPGDTTLTTLATFNVSNGSVPMEGLTADAAGNYFGMTEEGGANNDGVIFKLSGDDHRTLTTLITFDGTNGEEPGSGMLTPDAAGNLFGTTSNGGDLTTNGGFGIGVAFELTGSGFVPVPEPTGAALLAVSGVALLRRGRFRRATLSTLSIRKPRNRV